MTLREAEALKAGDKVYWTPAYGEVTSQMLTVQRIEIKGDKVYLTDSDGQQSVGYCTELHYGN